MSGRQPRGIRRWYATHAVARVCLLALTLNLYAPVAWAALMPAAGTDSAPTCHEMAPAPEHAPATPPSGDAQGLIPHCPLCVLFGGTSWAPPANAPVVIIAEARGVAAAPPVVAIPDAPRRLTLRPSPRAPPSSI